MGFRSCSVPVDFVFAFVLGFGPVRNVLRFESVKPEDYAYLEQTDGKSKTGKLRSPAIEPYRVLRKYDRTYVMDHEGATERINADGVTYAPPPENATAQQEEETGRHENNTEGPTCVVDEILNHRKDTNGSLEFHVKWYGYNETTWEPR